MPGYYCEKCQKALDSCKLMYNFSMRLCDHTEGVYVSLLGEYPAEDIIGMSAQGLKDLCDANPDHSAGVQDALTHPKLVE